MATLSEELKKLILGSIGDPSSALEMIAALESGSGGVGSLNSLTGDLDLLAGSNITITPGVDSLTIASTGGSPTGDPNTLSYFNAAGDLTDNASAKFDDTVNAISFGIENTGSITSSGSGSLASGATFSTGTISSTSTGSRAHGVAAHGSISATNEGALAHGYANDSGTGGNPFISATGIGSEAAGAVAGAGHITATSDTAYARGQSLQGGIIRASNIASFASGHVSNGTISASGLGSTSFGHASAGGASGISSTGDGSFAFGFTNGPDSNIIASGQGALANGLSESGFNISSQGRGSHAGGYAFTGVINANGSAAFAQGDFLDVSCELGTAFGLGHINSTYGAFVIGRFSQNVNGGNPITWVPEEPVFVVGNGTSIGVQSNAFQIDKDGKLLTTGSQVHRAIRAAVNPDLLSARTDRSLMVDTSVGADPFEVSMPPGEEGLEYFIKDTGDNAATNNIVFIADGGDSMETNSNIIINRGTRHFQFFDGTWWKISQS